MTKGKKQVIGFDRGKRKWGGKRQRKERGDRRKTETGRLSYYI